jgi:undecaprenyl-phosphate galactose phosphotransferase
MSKDATVEKVKSKSSFAFIDANGQSSFLSAAAANTHMALRQRVENWKPFDVAKQLHWYMILDAFALALAFACAWGIATFLNLHFLDRPLIPPQSGEDTHRFIQYLIIAGVVIFNLERGGHYRMRKPFWLETKNILYTSSIALIVDGFLQFAARADFSRMGLVLSWFLAALLIIAFRSAFRAYMRRTGRWQISALLIGNGSVAEDALRAIQSEPNLGYVMTAQVADLPKTFHDADQSWENIRARFQVDFILIALDGMELARAEEPIAQLMREGVPFSVSPPMRNMPVLGMIPQYFFSHDVMLLTYSKGLEQPVQRFIKRTFDIVAASTALLIASPFLAVIAAFVALDGGPVVYGHKRIGYKGKSFACLKFRSMVKNSEDVLRQHLEKNPEARAEWQREWKLHKDPRVTAIGGLLRRTSLDELPQLWNVLRGDMSLVGPRPIVVAEADKYNSDIAYYCRVRPGITGLWQVSGRNDVSYAKRVQMDAWYVRNWSLWHDVAIICKTIPVLINRSGAY